MTLAVGFLGLVNLFYGEIIPAGGGLGYDGTTYAHLVRHFGSIIFSGELSPYYAHRILSPVIVRAGLILAGSSFSDFDIIRAFQIYNLVLLISATILWKRISDISDLSLSGRWIGFAGLFLSFMGSKFVFYYPVLTDVTGLFFGLLCLLLYLEKKPFLLFFTALIGSFAWPLVGLCGALLLVFMWSKPACDVLTHSSKDRLSDRADLVRILSAGWVLLLALSILGFIVLLILVEHLSDSGGSVSRIAGFRVNTWKRGITGLPSLAVIIIGLAMLAGSWRYIIAVMRDVLSSRFISLALGILVLVIPWYVFREVRLAYHMEIGLSEPSNLTLTGALNAVLIAGQPGKFLLPFVSLAVYWGPVVLLLLLKWNEFCRASRRLGAGFVGVVALMLLLGLATEPRFITFGWPFLVLGLALVMDRTEKPAMFKYVLLFLIVVYGQFWMKLNLAPWVGEYNDSELLEFPRQVYFMHFGMWMSWWSYLLQGLAVLLSLFWLRKNLGGTSHATAPALEDKNR